MECEHCGDTIADADTRYEEVVPVDGGGQTMDAFCSISCLNRDVGYSQEEIEALMVQEGIDVQPDYESEWTAAVEPENVQANRDAQGEHFIALSHVSKEYDVEIFFDPIEKLYEVSVWEYDMVEGEKMGYDTTSTMRTGVHQRALKHARDYMDRIEDGTY
ncbi:hypothetical protein OB920_13155 [Halobacteria archaeon HArc-gm2]|nr:hypothetical protein [Halobacteria archaeon HArc-gm2]